MKLILSVALLFLLLLGYFQPVDALTQDLGRHILTGNIILREYRVPTTNLFSYTNPDFPVINTHWFSEVVFALVDSFFSIQGLFILMLILVAGAFIVQLFSVYKYTSLPALGIGGILYTRILFERTDLRPELFSYLFLSITVALLYYYREKTTKLILFLVPIQLLWVNMHIYFAIGLLVQGLFFLDILYRNRGNLFSPAVKLFGITFLGSVIISCINPHAVAGMLYPLHVFSNYGYTIEENQTVFFLESLGFHKPSFPYLKITVVLLFFSLSVSFRKTRPIDWMLSVVFTVLAFGAVRNMPLFVFATFIPFTYTFTMLLQKGCIFIKPYRYLNDYKMGISLTMLFLLITWQIIAVSNLFSIGYGVTPGAEKAVNFLEKERITGPLFNNFDIGGYLISRLYPGERVFVDGRPEAYPEAFFREIYKPMQENQAVFDIVTERYGIDTVFFPHTDQTPWGITFLQWVINHPDWRIVYVDDYAIILLKQTPENETVIKKYAMNPKNLRIIKTDNSFEANLRIVAFLAKTNLTEQAIPYLYEIVRIKPDYCPVLGMLAEMLQGKRDPGAIIYASQYQQNCK